MFQRFSSVVTGLLVAAGCFSSNLSGAAPTLSWHSWDPYRDRFGLINSVLVDQATHNPSTNNGPLYTAEACVIMQLRKVAYDRNAIASAIASCEVEKGLYRHSPTDPQDQDTAGCINKTSCNASGAFSEITPSFGATCSWQTSCNGTWTGVSLLRQ
jgi:hypothetical protein